MVLNATKEGEAVPKGIHKRQHLTGRPCEHCGQIFIPKQGTQRFDSARCRLEAFREARALALAHEMLDEFFTHRKVTA